MADCIFCKIVAGEVDTRMVHEDELSLVFKDLNPAAPTHLLAIPKKHIEGLAASGNGDKELLGHLQCVLREVAVKEGLEDFRIVANNGRKAGQSVFHLHYHLLAGRRMAWPPG